MLYENQELLDLDSEEYDKFGEFYSAKLAGNAVLFVQMKEYIDDNDGESAFDVLESIVPDDEFEENLLTCFDIYINYDMKETEYTELVRGVLEDFAYGDYYEIGEAVFMARAMLNLILDDEGNVQRKKSSIISKINSEIKVFPNPAQNEITIELLENNSNSKIQILDIYSRLVYSNSIYNLKKIVDISSLKSGIYFCNIISKDNISKSIRFIKE